MPTTTWSVSEKILGSRVTHSLLAGCTAVSVASGPASAQHVNSWGDTVVDSALHEDSFAGIAAGYSFTVGRRNDGSLVAWGSNSHLQCQVPTLPQALVCVEVAAGDYHGVARLSDGSAVAWGWNNYGQCNVPVGLSFVDVVAGGFHSVALLSDGAIIGWGANTHGQSTAPGLPFELSCVELAAGYRHNVARLSDGSVIAWGDNTYGQCDVP